MSKIDEFAGIKRIALLIAYDNGMINRFCTEEQWLSNLDPVLGADGVYHADLVILDAWCMTLNDQEAEDLAAGESQDMKAVAEKCPNPDLVGLFEDIFNA